MEEEMSGAGGEDVAAAPAEGPAAPKRGRGRPRKQPQEPADPAAPRRPRGRPRGSKNKAHRSTATRCPVCLCKDRVHLRYLRRLSGM
ncbi:hypothetical protein NFI96_028148 [Prochilodus magdalenae]|nr:hypothetical protein NFI96_028148 [Prochilodus magdalenae]